MIKYFYSMKTALLLMTAIVAVSIFATFESNIQIYDSYLFKGLLIFLITNITLCTIIRTQKLLVKLQNKSFDEKKKVFSNIPKLKTWDMHSVRKKIENVFRQKGYRIIHLQGNHESIIYLKKGILSLIANQVVHYALIIIFIGALISSFSFNGEVSGGVSQVVDLPIKLVENNLKIRIDDFNTLYNPDQTIKNWETKLTIINGETKITQGRTSVNHPFRYQDITIYQSGYEYTYLVELNKNQYPPLFTVE